MKSLFTKPMIILMIAGLLVGCATASNPARMDHDSMQAQESDERAEQNMYKLTPEERRELVKSYKELMNPT